MESTLNRLFWRCCKYIEFSVTVRVSISQLVPARDHVTSFVWRLAIFEMLPQCRQAVVDVVYGQQAVEMYVHARCVSGDDSGS